MLGGSWVGADGLGLMGWVLAWLPVVKAGWSLLRWWVLGESADLHSCLSEAEPGCLAAAFPSSIWLLVQSGMGTRMLA